MLATLPCAGSSIGMVCSPLITILAASLQMLTDPHLDARHTKMMVKAILLSQASIGERSAMICGLATRSSTNTPHKGQAMDLDSRGTHM